MITVLISALLASIIYTWFATPFLVVAISILGFLLPAIVFVCLYFIHVTPEYIKAPVFKRINDRLRKDNLAHRLIEESSALCIGLAGVLMFTTLTPVILFLGIGSTLYAKKLLNHMNFHYEKDFAEAMEVLMKDKK